jgi:hypothetical protein
MDRSDRKRVWLAAVILGLVVWFLLVQYGSTPFFKIFYPRLYSLSPADRPSHSFVYVWLIIVCPILAGLISWSCLKGLISLAEMPGKKRAAMENERRRLEAETNRLARIKAEEQRRAAEKAAQHARTTEQLASLVSSTQAAAARLPAKLVDTENALDHAQDEFAHNIPSSFWEWMENAVLHLSVFEAVIDKVVAARIEHDRLTSLLGSSAPGFTLGLSVLPDASHTRDRMKRLYRDAQAAPDSRFAIIYEQRRSTRALERGFTSLAEALTTLGGRIETALNELGHDVGIKLVDLRSALSDSITSLRDQQIRLIEVATAARRETNASSAELIAIKRTTASRVEQHLKDCRKYEEEALAASSRLEQLAANQRP